MMNNQHKSVNYRIIQSHIEDSLGKKVPLSDIQRYSREECGIKWRKVQELTLRDRYQPLIIVNKSSAYAELYNFIGAINGSQAIACMTLTPADRKNRNI
ncbi:unnamed protein product [Rotaria sp. Silwood2]|nr:unnamed protein product [Rotaria sp. Silwood2]